MENILCRIIQTPENISFSKKLVHFPEVFFSETIAALQFSKSMFLLL